MNVFVLSTGRCGSTTFAKACEPMTNFTVAHESERRRDYGQLRMRYQSLRYPENHIEADNRLSWFLGTLDDLYGKNAFYVHLLRDREEVARSHLRRWKQRKTNIIFSFAWGILTHPYDQVEKLSEDDRLEIGRQYWDTVNANIRSFLHDKPLQATLWLHDIKPGFEKFWYEVGAEGNLDSALSVWDTLHNETGSKLHNSMSPIGKELRELIDHNSTWIVVDDGKLESDAFADRHVLPFIERDGEYWGPPESDEQAVAELDRLRNRGANFLVFIASSFWWLDYYAEFRDHLESKFVRTLSDDELVVFDLGSVKATKPLQGLE